MLSKCANSACAKSFRYLHEGKLFWREPGKGFIKNQICKGEWFWLCDQCLPLWEPWSGNLPGWVRITPS
jgi:hypothetical protein